MVSQMWNFPELNIQEGRGHKWACLQVEDFWFLCVCVRACVFDGDSSGTEQNGQDGDVTALLRWYNAILQFQLVWNIT